MQKVFACLEYTDFISQHRTIKTAFVRKRILTFKVLVLFLMNLLKGSLQDELDLFFTNIRNNPSEVREVSKAAFSKARRYLSHTAFIALNQSLLEEAYAESETSTWQGYRLCAIDGSTLRLPNRPSIVSHFGRQQKSAIPMARLSQLYDVLNSVTLNVQVASIFTGERDLALKHIESSKPNDLILYDRGYPAFTFYAAHRHWQRHYVMRLAMNSFPGVDDFIRSEDSESLLTIRPSSTRRKECEALGISAENIQIRIVKVILDTGEIEVLGTNLFDDVQYPLDCFKSLYHMRWAVEEDYKTKKHVVEIENFSGLSVESIYQDIHVKVLTQNLVSLVGWIAKPEIDHAYSSRKLKYKLNLAQAISKSKNTLISIIYFKNSKKILRSLVNMFVITVEPIRNGRSFIRKKTKLTRNFYSNRKRAR